MRPWPLRALALSLVLAACSAEDGRSLPPPPETATTTPAAGPVVGQPTDEDGVAAFTLTSAAFADGAPIPTQHTCDGADLSPPLTWAATPPAAELAIVVRDDDADGFVHWVVAGIDPLVQGLGEGGVPEGAVEAGNDFGTVGWRGPCPPPGSTHTYSFSLHVLPEPLALEPGRAAEEAATMVEGAASATATLTGTYAR